MAADQPLNGAMLKTITIRLGAEAGHLPTEVRQELVLGALAAALIAINDSSSPAWTVQEIPDGAPWSYQLTPLAGNVVSGEAARRMVHELRAQPQIALAEPTFITPHLN
jgi:hypothetical protein